MSCLSTADTCPVSTASIGPVSTADLCPIVLLNCLLHEHSHLCRRAVVSIFAILFFRQGGSICIEYAHEAQVVFMGATKKKKKTPLPPPPPPICVICDRPLSYYVPTNPRFWRIRPQITHLSCWVKLRRRHRKELGGA